MTLRIDVSIVIPTRNRLESLNRLLKSIAEQTASPAEILIVDSSDDDQTSRMVVAHANQTVLKSKPSVCAQRNLGIKKARAKYILLCDDDIELPEDYLFVTSEYLKKNPERVVVTGLWAEPEEDGKWVTQYPVKSLPSLLYSWCFGLSIWGSVSEIETSLIVRPIHKALVGYYKKKNNTLTKAGWPIVTEYHFPVNRVAVTSLGSALICKTYFEGVQFDEGLAPHGYGDNYGVCIQFPGPRPVDILMTCIVKHHHVNVNRNPSEKATYLRTLALHSFIRRSDRFGRFTLFCFYWSLIGQCLKSLFSGNSSLLKVYIKVFSRILRGSNPYLKNR